MTRLPLGPIARRRAADVAPEPSHLLLGAPRPNPFRTLVRFPVSLREAGVVEARVFDTAGRAVRELFHGSMAAGVQTLAWDGLDSDRRPAAAGTYFVVVRTGGEQRLGRAVLLR